MPTDKTIITKKGKYADGTSRRVLIKWIDGQRKIKAIPHPDKLWELLDTAERLNLIQG